MDVYAVDVTGTLDKGIYERLLARVSPEKRARIPRFYREEDRIRGLMADILARGCITRETGLENHRIEFYTNDYGKPFLKGRDDFQFNLSHSGAWVVGAVDNQPIGIDVERIQPIDLDISKNYFSPDEHQDLMAHQDKFAYFFTLWSLKESYIKIVGKGLSLPLNSFSIKFFSPGDIRIKAEGRLLEDIFFQQYDIHKDYKMAVCAHHREFPAGVRMMTMAQLAVEFLGD
ncbi:MAG: 4'-phosphopantetheinyl transferase superfamily protein [Candidatus Aminicenantes bacterium]|nr:4'-phosphopantetheinyl transferase superfamily protein [Candidatus Aminicenantes bacterium]